MVSNRVSLDMIQTMPSPAQSFDGQAPARARGEDSALAHALSELETLIVEDSNAGDQLPSEAALAEQFGVSRLTIREGLKVLAGQGLVEMSRGRRPTVRHPDSSVMSRFLSVAIRRDARAALDLLSIRRSLEVLSVKEAAKRVNRAALSALGGALDEMQRAGDALDGSQESIARYNSADVAFHEALALASGNQMLALLLESLSESLHVSFAQSFAGFMAAGGNVADAIAEHRTIYDRVAAGDASGAELAMSRHLERTARDLQAVLPPS